MKNLASGRRRAATLAVTVMCVLALCVWGRNAYAQQPDMLVRISEIEIFPAHLQEYQRILKEESEASVRIEPGVLCIFPAFQKDRPTEVRVLEIYASRAAYEAHIQSPHFQKYKTSTLDMVKSLQLIDMQAVDASTMPFIFRKMNGQP